MFLNSLFKHWSYRTFAPDVLLRRTYESFKHLLVDDGRCHDLMAEFDVLYHDGKREDFSRIRKRYDHFAASVFGMIENFAELDPPTAGSLKEYFTKFDFYIRFLLAPPEQFNIPPYVEGLDTTPDIASAGNKAHNLALLQNELQASVPPGFFITTTTFFSLIEQNNLRPSIDDLLAEIDIEDPRSLVELSNSLMAIIRSAEIPPAIRRDIMEAYDRMEQQYGGPVYTAVRSSAISEDSEYSFAGQYRTVLAAGRETILAAYLDVVASKYAPEALLYRITLGLADEEAPIAVLVLAMVDATASGIVYTCDPAGKRDQGRIVIHSVRGLGEPLVGGAASPDILIMDRRKLDIVQKRQGRQREKLILGQGQLKEVVLDAEEIKSFSLSDAQGRDLASWGMKIEGLYGRPQDVEWAITGDGTLFLLQARPLRQEPPSGSENEGSEKKYSVQPLLVGGKRAAGGVACGVVYQVGEGNLRDIPDGSVLVTRSTPPSLVRVMNRLAAVVADRGSTAGHFATVCREFRIPLLVDTEKATSLLVHGRSVTVDADHTAVYPGRIEALVQGKEGREEKKNLPYFKKLRGILDFITPLKLIDPRSPDFQARSCRSMHDIIRFTHERAVQTMFSLGNKVSGRSGRSRQLQTELPLEVYLLDVGGGICVEAGEGIVPFDQIYSVPFRAIWQGLSHRGIDWDSHSHFDWKSFDDVVLAGGIATRKSGDYASYAVISQDYLNLNMRFGYHFTLVDALCGEDIRSNYCRFRFAGGGGDYTGRSLRIEFVSTILTRLGFEVDVRADLLDAGISVIECKELCRQLDMVGRLLGATKLMDMILREGMDVQLYVERFFAGEYTFSSF